MYIIDGKDFAKCIDAYCSVNGITKEELYKDSGISTANLAQWRGGAVPSAKKIKAFEEYSKIKVDDLFSLFLGTFSEKTLLEQIKNLEIQIKNLDGKELFEAQQSLEILQESLEGLRFANSIKTETPAAQGDGLTEAQKELMRIIPDLTEAEAAVLVATAKAQVAARKLRDDP